MNPNLCCLALIAGLALADSREFEIEYEYSISDHVRPQRIIAELSLDNGASWRPLAYGVPSEHGTNVLTISVPARAGMLSEWARVRLTELPYRGLNVTNSQRGVLVSEAPFSLAGCFIQAPASGAFWRVSQPTVLRWVQAAGGEFMQVGISTDGQMFEPVAVIDSLAAPASNAYVFIPSAWGVTNAGAVWVGLQSLTDPKVQAVAGPVTVSP